MIHGEAYEQAPASKLIGLTDSAHWKRQESDVGAAPTGVLHSRALVAACGTAGAFPKHIARGVGAPADNSHGTRQRRVMLTALAVQPEPRRRAVQVAERCRRARGLHGADWTPGERLEFQPLLIVVDWEGSTNTDRRGVLRSRGSGSFDWGGRTL